MKESTSDNSRIENSNSKGKSSEIVSLDHACQLGLISHISSATHYLGLHKCALPRTIRTWMIHSDIVFYTTSKSTWLASGERIIINKNRHDMTIAPVDPLHGLPQEQLAARMDSFSADDIISSDKHALSLSDSQINLLITTQWGLSNIYHLIFDCLAKIDVAQKIYPRQSICVLVPEGSLLPQILDLLQYSYTPYKRDQLIQGKICLPSMPRFTGNISIDTRSFLSSASSHVGPGSTKAIYISREQGRRRSILNEEELLTGLSTVLHLDVVRLERLSVFEQIELMKGVSVVVAPHGAGLSWVAFNSNPCHIFEIFSSDYVNSCFNGVNHRDSLHERYIESDTTQAAGFRVSVNKLVEAFAAFVANVNQL